MAMGSSGFASAGGSGTGAISRGALDDDGPAATAEASTVVADAAVGDSGAAATATDATAGLGAGLCAAMGAGGFEAGFIPAAVASVALYPAADCRVDASMTATRGLGGTGCAGTAGLRSLA